MKDIHRRSKLFRGVNIAKKYFHRKVSYITEIHLKEKLYSKCKVCPPKNNSQFLQAYQNSPPKGEALEKVFYGGGGVKLLGDRLSLWRGS